MSALRSVAAAGVAACCLLLIWTKTDRGAPVQAVSSRITRDVSFRITFGVKRQFPNVSWAGGFRNAAQVRSVAGWHLDTSDAMRPPAEWDITLRPAGRDITAKGVLFELTGPETEPVTFFTRQGDFTFVPAAVQYGKPFAVPGTGEDIVIDRVPLSRKVSGPATEDDDPVVMQARDGTLWLAWVGYKTIARNGYYYDGADQVLVSRSSDGVSWSAPVAVTTPGDHFRVSLAEDASGRIWCVYGLQKRMESGNFDLFARSYDGERWSDEEQLTSSPFPDIFHRMTADKAGNLYLVWMSYRAIGGGAPQSDIFLRVRTAQGWQSPVAVTESADNDWEPAVTAAGGEVWIAWDSYRANTGYDVMLRGYRAGQFSPVRTVSSTPFAEMRADVAADAQGRVWVAWEEGGAHWGKDTGYENAKHRINLRKGGSFLYGPANSAKALYRRPRVAILENGVIHQPAASLDSAYPASAQANLFQNPRLGVDGNGRIWVFLRHQLLARGRNAGHLFDYYTTTLAGEGNSQQWLGLVLLPGSTGRQDTVLSAAPASGGGLLIAVAGDGRRLPVGLPENHDVSCLVLHPPVTAQQPVLAAFQPSAAPAVPPPHPNESAEVERIRKHRVTAGGTTYKIVRGDLHRHTEISMDGAVDGSLWDLYRYALDAAAFDYIAVTDHNYGAWLDTDEPDQPGTDDIYQWWRTQKSADLFLVPGRFVPLYAYERSVNFPLGHRNIIHERRGVFSLRVPRLHVAERKELIEKDAQSLWAYLRDTGGVGLPHTSGTSMGTDWRLRDDPLEPVTEIYQGDRNSYEEEGAPRAAIPESVGDGGAGRAPFQKGLIWNALGAGYRMGFIASSDHFSTHISYANILVPDRVATRADIQDALRARRTYASTDNIIVDFSAGGLLQGEAGEAGASPVFTVQVIGTAPLKTVEVIKNNRVVYTARGGSDPARAAFTFRDVAEFGGDFSDTSMAPTSQIKDWSRPETGIRGRPQGPESYYYVRVVQSFDRAEPERDGEVAWSSPIFIRRSKK